jgi:hypothetical protein
MMVFGKWPTALAQAFSGNKKTGAKSAPVSSLKQSLGLVQ